jgi:hypothetical protein
MHVIAAEEMAREAILRNAGLKMDMFVLVAVEASSGMDEYCWNAFELLLTKAKNPVECAIGTISVVVHHGGKSFVVIATAHTLVRFWWENKLY